MSWAMPPFPQHTIRGGGVNGDPLPGGGVYNIQTPSQGGCRYADPLPSFGEGGGLKMQNPLPNLGGG